MTLFRFVLVVILFYLIVRALINLVDAVRDESGYIPNQDPDEEERYAGMDIEDAEWEEIE